jgi:hypothetical protein
VSLHDYNFTKRKWWEVSVAAKPVEGAAENERHERGSDQRNKARKSQVGKRISRGVNHDWWERELVRDVWIYALDAEGGVVRADAEVAPR